MKRFLFAAAVFWSVQCAIALPTMPEGFRLIVSDDTGKTWRETGDFALSVDAVLSALRDSLNSQGYVERYDIADGDAEDGHVMLWSSKEEDIILSLWPKPSGRTGCSWGLSPRAPTVSANDATPNLSQPRNQTNAKETHHETHQHDNSRDAVRQDNLASPTSSDSSLAPGGPDDAAGR